MGVRALAVAIVLSVVSTSDVLAWEPGWWGVVVARGNDKARIEATPIVNRPYRPLHFYGNTIRRDYYRGNPLPMPRDFVNGAVSVVARRKLRL